MSIKVNTNTTKVTVYDEIGYKHASTDDVVTLVTKDKDDLIGSIINIIADSISLNDSERELYKCMTAYLRNVKVDSFKDDLLDVNYIIESCASINNKSCITYKRALEVLIKLGVVKYYQGYSAVMFNPQYDVVSINNKARYVVIEVI